MLKAYTTAVVLSALAIGGWLANGSDSSAYISLDRGGEPLKSAFNADVGKVRVLMLVAPT